ncbi:MAG: hypothetical protein R3293_20730 [Candidatus Promineifilaceae bacterium]|nr:hypothetical protein [Candidatus Promineifilaceae bacterium]
MTTTIGEPSKNSAANNPQPMSQRWVTVGGVLGIAGSLFYFLAIAPILPAPINVYFGLAFGPMISVAYIGIYHFVKAHRDSITLQIAVLFGIIAGTIVNMMLVVQQSLVLGLAAAERSQMGSATWQGFNLVQLGLDVSWDIYISLASVLLGAAILDHPRFGRLMGGITMLLGGSLLVLNMTTFPIPPAQAGSIDLGPVVGTWYLILMIRMLRSRSWFAKTVEREELPIS